MKHHLFFLILNPLFLGSLKKYKMISPEKIATCMQKLADSKSHQSIFSSDEIDIRFVDLSRHTKIIHGQSEYKYLKENLNEIII